jgi:hypothetical protein
LAVAGGTAAGLLAAAIIFQKKKKQKNEKLSINGGIINRPVAGKSTAGT